MTDFGTGKLHDLADEMRNEFLDEVVEVLQELDVKLDSGRNGHQTEAEVIEPFRRAALRFKGQAANFGLRQLATVVLRLDDYVTHAPRVMPPRLWDDLQSFIDIMLALAEGRLDPDTETAALVRKLPARLGFDVGDIEVRNVEVMLVMPPGAQTRFVEREMQQCGYRVSVVPDTIEAFSQAVQTKPDLIVVSALMPHLDGIDLAIGLVSMPATRNIPIAVITSLDQGDERLALLPHKVPVLHKGPSFGDDLFKALDDLFLI
ncbi:MAG: Hpt domain-containing protein [Alphaproteobacteria bacterium]|nr:Hpt domain-containing protein [Alphaproteobacteria bacterium]